MNYFIGDLHFFNRNQTGEGVNYDGRPFATVAEMNQYILEHWNAKITNGDTVYILGDMAMRGRNEALIALVAQLKGRKILFRGNHDDLSDYRYQKLFADITDYREISESFDGQSYKLCLMHYPILMWNGQHRGSILLYLDIAICLVALMPVSLAFKPRKSYMSTAIDTVKEILIRPIQML